MDTWRGMWIHVCGVGGKRPCAISTDILEFRLIGVHARIGTVRSSRSTLISYSRQPSLRGCIANHWEINDLGKHCTECVYGSLCTFTKSDRATITAKIGR